MKQRRGALNRTSGDPVRGIARGQKIAGGYRWRGSADRGSGPLALLRSVGGPCSHTLARHPAPCLGARGHTAGNARACGSEQGKAPKATIFAPDLRALERLLRAGNYPVNGASISPSYRVRRRLSSNRSILGASAIPWNLTASGALRSMFMQHSAALSDAPTHRSPSQILTSFKGA